MHAPRGSSPCSWWYLLRPRWLTARNRYRQQTGQRWQRLFVAVLAGAFSIGVFVFFYRVLLHFLSVPEFGPILTYKLLAMVFLTFLSVLLFSNIVTALSTFFLSAELDRLVAAPIPARTLFAARFAETVLESSWMVVLFGVPAFVAYGLAHQAGAAFYAGIPLVLAPFVLVPAAVGVALTAVLVHVFPARRARDLLVLLAILALAVLYLSLRLLQPERLVQPEAFAEFTHFLVAMRTPTAPYLPSSWAAEILHGLARGEWERVPVHLGALFLAAAVTTAAAGWLTVRLFPSGFSKAQEGRRARYSASVLSDRVFDTALSFCPQQARRIVGKEVRTFFRDTSQWSQLILLLALVVVYVYNFSVLPLGGFPLVSFYFRNVISFLNLLLASFVVTSVALRFVFPALSLEGKALWIARTAPMRLETLWWSKFFVALVPLMVLAEALILITNHYLRVLPFMRWLAPLTMFGLTVGITAISLATGTRYPKFDAEHAAKIATGIGGLVSMVLCMSFATTVIILQAWPVYVIFSNYLQEEPLSRAAWASVVGSLAASALLMIGATALAIRWGLRALDDLAA